MEKSDKNETKPAHSNEHHGHQHPECLGYCAAIHDKTRSSSEPLFHSQSDDDTYEYRLPDHAGRQSLPSSNNTDILFERESRASQRDRGRRASSQDSEERKNIARERNRLATERFRNRRRQAEAELEESCNTMAEENAQLSTIVRGLAVEIQVLKNLMLHHASCHCNQADGNAQQQVQTACRNQQEQEEKQAFSLRPSSR